MEPTQILLVEDDPNDVELIQIALERYNFVNRIDVVPDGEQAIHYLGIAENTCISTNSSFSGGDDDFISRNP